MERTLLTRILSVGIAASAVIGGGGATVWAHSSPTPVNETSNYTVQAGDSLDGIARRLGVAFADLLAANSLTATSVIHPGDTLKVPAGATNSPPTPTPTGPTTSYTVKAGDGLASIAAAQRVTLAALLKANGLKTSSVIHPGQVLRIPGSTSATPVATTPTDTLTTYLQAQVGKPYKFFTAGPDTFDCSGLVIAGYRQIGIELPHQSRALSKVGTAVDWKSSPIKAGDLVFMYSANDLSQIGHVGVALNSTMWIQAVGPGIPVRIRALPSADRIVAVRRVIEP